MNHYVLMFRATRPITPEENKTRFQDIQQWVKRVTEMGIALDPKALGDTAIQFTGKDGAVTSREGPVDPALTNLVFFDAASKDQAVEVARMHPGVHYGVIVELRDWAAPRPAAAKTE